MTTPGAGVPMRYWIEGVSCATKGIGVAGHTYSIGEQIVLDKGSFISYDSK